MQGFRGHWAKGQGAEIKESESVGGEEREMMAFEGERRQCRRWKTRSIGTHLPFRGKHFLPFEIPGCLWSNEMSVF